MANDKEIESPDLNFEFFFPSFPRVVHQLNGNFSSIRQNSFVNWSLEYPLVAA